MTVNKNVTVIDLDEIHSHSAITATAQAIVPGVGGAAAEAKGHYSLTFDSIDVSVGAPCG